jgi:uncharacterized membrane protein
MRAQRILMVIAAMVGVFGLVDSGYLTIKHLQGSYVRCEDDCSAVLGSVYAEGIAGVPLAGFGAMAYATVIVAAVFAACGSTIGRRVLTVMATIMAFASVWLIYLQAFVIHSFCKFCLASAAACFTLAALVLTDWRLRRRLRSGISTIG